MKIPFWEAHVMRVFGGCCKSPAVTWGLDLLYNHLLWGTGPGLVLQNTVLAFWGHFTGALSARGVWWRMFTAYVHGV